MVAGSKFHLISIPTHDTKQAFMQNGNAIYNMTTHVIQAGDVLTFLWEFKNTVAHNVTMVSDNAGTITSFGPTVGNNKAACRSGPLKHLIYIPR